MLFKFLGNFDDKFIKFENVKKNHPLKHLAFIADISRICKTSNMYSSKVVLI